MKDICIDVETLGIRPGSMILSIGAVEFDINQHPEFSPPFENTFYANVAKNSRFKTDQATINWWADQSYDARASLESPPPVTIEAALLALDRWVREIKTGEGLRVWSRGPSFDMSMIAEAYAIVGPATLSVPVRTPWYYNQERDARTLIEAAKATAPDEGGLDFYAFERERFNGRIKHFALHDAMADAEMVMMSRHILDARFP